MSVTSESVCPTLLFLNMMVADLQCTCFPALFYFHIVSEKPTVFHETTGAGRPTWWTQVRTEFLCVLFHVHEADTLILYQSTVIFDNTLFQMSFIQES